MAKRHDSLLLLARDHHEALLLAVRLQQGTKALLRLWTHAPEGQAKHVVEFYDRHLKKHFAEEEQILFPITGQNIPSALPIIDRLIAEHRAMERAVSRFRTGSKSLQDELLSFGKLLEEHVRTEDRTLFPIIEEQASEKVLAEIQERLNRYHHGREDR